MVYALSTPSTPTPARMHAPCPSPWRQVAAGHALKGGALGLSPLTPLTTPPFIEMIRTTFDVTRVEPRVVAA